MKTEPLDYSWERLVADGETEWTGVRNHQAAANMRAMRVGERAFFYRSLKDPAIVGVMTIAAEAYPDPEDATGRGSSGVRVRPQVAASREISLKAIKADARFVGLALVRQSRLSVMPVSQTHWRLLAQLAGIDA